ncbi:MAG: type II secretion system protein GspM [Parasphingorhabdus sp.]|uniref:type II secretion system protein GspM n=1 Tax=Parasphingorhabdus sp. TaxID=2709688 RepID=UPI00329774AE
MRESLHNWFRALSQREKIMVGCAGLLAALVIGYYAIIKPFSGAYSEAQTRHAEVVEARARIEGKVATLQDNTEDSVKPHTGSLDVFISQNAGEAGFAVGKLDAQTDGSVRLTIDAAKPTALFSWLTKLETRGIAVEELAVNPGSNKTVSATILLRSVQAK